MIYEKIYYLRHSNLKITKDEIIFNNYLQSFVFIVLYLIGYS